MRFVGSDIFHLCVEKVSTTKATIYHGGFAHVGFCKARIMSIYIAQVRFDQDCLIKERFPDVGTCEVCLGEVGFVEARIFEVRAPQICASHADVTEAEAFQVQSGELHS